MASNYHATDPTPRSHTSYLQNMCGRYVSPEKATIKGAVDIGRQRNVLWKPSYNTAPTMAVPVLLGDSKPGYTLDSARWGFIPNWWKQAEAPRNTINARVESAADKPMWREALAKQRCLVPAMGWYEWAQREHIDPDTGEVQSIKQPYFLHAPDGALLLFAGLYSDRSDERTGAALTVAILTSAASGEAEKVHDRMPVILSGEAATRWVAPDQHDKAMLNELLETGRSDDITTRPISRRVNSPRNDGPELINAIEADAP